MRGPSPLPPGEGGAKRRVRGGERINRASLSHKYGNMGCMKTTVELPDELLIAAKKRAAELRRPLRSLIEEGLRSVLNQDQPKPRKKTLRLVTVKGGLAKDLDVSNRESMYEWLRKNR